MTKTKPDWRIYYADDTTFDSTQGTWEDAPADGVICVLRPDEKNTSAHLSERDFYMKPPGHDEVIVTDDLGPQLRALKWIKFGLWIPREKYQEIMGRAIHDTDFPRRRPT